jgi:hypothetical protein
MNTRTPSHTVVAAIAATLLVLLATFPALSACGGGTSNVDPLTVLSESSAKMKTLTGFHFVYEVHKPQGSQPAPGLEIGRMTGDINAAGDMTSIVDATYGGLPVTLGIVALGDTYYVQDPISLKWQSVAAVDSPVGKLNLNAGTIRILDNITDTSYVGEESKGGAKTYHIKGSVSDVEVKAIAGLVDLGVTPSFPTDIWIGVSDSLVYEVDIKGAATVDETKDYSRSIIVSDFNESVTVEAPQ